MHVIVVENECYDEK